MVVSEETKAKPRIRFGLRAIKNVGENIAKVIIHERKTNGPYKNLEDFLLRVQDKDLNKKSLESLIKSGTLDSFGQREDFLENLDKLLKFGKKTNDHNQQNLFAGSATPTVPKLTLNPAEPISKQQKLSWEKQLLGVYLSEHPLKEVEKFLPPNLSSCRQLGQLPKDRPVRVAGIITKIQKVITRKGDPMLFVTIEDNTGNVEVLVFSNVLEKSRDLWQEDKIVVLSGKISDKDGVPKIICDKVSAVKTT
jgi:DNA polymerase-3 subunit alpha